MDDVISAVNRLSLGTGSPNVPLLECANGSYRHDPSCPLRGVNYAYIVGGGGREMRSINDPKPGWCLWWEAFRGRRSTLGDQKKKKREGRLR